jgi:hypothetical protein
MTSLHKSASFHVFSLVSAALAFTTMLGVAVGQCGPGLTDACRWGAGNPCPPASQCVGNTYSAYCNSYTESSGASSYNFKDSGLVNGNWYRCTQVTGSFASTGACAESGVICSTTTLYKDAACSIPCKYTGINLGCQAGAAAPICTYIQ